MLLICNRRTVPVSVRDVGVWLAAGDTGRHRLADRQSFQIGRGSRTKRHCCSAAPCAAAAARCQQH